jgi:hypothetical protein
MMLEEYGSVAALLGAAWIGAYPGAPVGCDLRHMARHASAVARICVVVR